MTYPNFEARMSREQAHKTLSRICERLDVCSSAALTNVYFRNGTPRVRTVQRLWVVGSYARGATTCGDIDLVMEMDSPYYRVKELNRVFLKSPKRVSLYVGTPEDNTSGVEFPEAHLVWEAGKDWHELVDGITPDPDATRFERLTDSIPLRMGQLSYCSPEWAESAVARKASGELDWLFLSLDEVAVGMELGEATAGLHYERLYEVAHSKRVGTKGRELLPFVEAYARRFGRTSQNWMYESQTRIRYGRTLFVLGTTPCLGELDEPGVSQIVVMPHLNARGPNGYWVVKRGAQHPLVKAFEGCEAWLITEANGEPAVASWSGWSPVSTYSRYVDGLDVFRTEADALDFLREGTICFPQGEVDTRSVRHIKGEEFRAVIEGCDLLEAGFCCAVFSQQGLRRVRMAGLSDDEFTVCSIAELVAIFRSVEGSPAAADTANRFPEVLPLAA
jgi:hypothetical protein